jgi:hypothetical protein
MGFVGYSPRDRRGEASKNPIAVKKIANPIIRTLIFEGIYNLPGIFHDAKKDTPPVPCISAWFSSSIIERGYWQIFIARRPKTRQTVCHN